jgi:hypothetical protein
MINKTCLISCVVLMLSACGAAAQDDVSEQLWLDYHEHFYFKPNWEFYGDGGFRTILANSDWQRLYVRPSVRFHSPKHPWEGRGGVGLFYTKDALDVNQLELRPWLGLRIRWPRFEPLTFSNYFRLEGRLIWETEDWELDETLRFRYQLGTRIPLELNRVQKYFYLPVSAEWFTNLGRDVAESYSSELRLNAGLGYVFNYVWAGEFHFILQRSRSGKGLSFETTDLIFRFQVKRLWSALDYMERES